MEIELVSARITTGYSAWHPPMCAFRDILTSKNCQHRRTSVACEVHTRECKPSSSARARLQLQLDQWGGIMTVSTNNSELERQVSGFLRALDQSAARGVVVESGGGGCLRLRGRVR